MWQGSYEFTVNQWGVGHGGFHSQSLFFQPLLRSATRPANAGSMLRIVYDCGSGRGLKPRAALLSAVDRMLDDIPHGSTIDLLAISHFDRDHINGLEHFAEMLRERSIDVKRVWAPILSKIEALYAITRSGLNGIELEPYAAFLGDPAGILSEFFPDSDVSLIPVATEPVPLPPAPEIDENDTAQDLSDETVVLGRAAAGRGLVAQRSSAASTEVLWELQPYVIPSVLIGASAVHKTLVSHLNKPVESCTLAELIALANDASLSGVFHAAVRAHHFGRSTAVRTSSARSGPNLSSLCLYSGPASPYEWCRARGGWQPISANPRAIPGAPSWLGTGDAGLLRTEDVDGLRTVLTPHRLDRVGITSAPHHGSHLDSAAPLWDALPNVRRVTIEAHNANGGKGNAHPHTQVLNELTHRNLTFHVCTDDNDFRCRDKRFR